MHFHYLFIYFFLQLESDLTWKYLRYSFPEETEQISPIYKKERVSVQHYSNEGTHYCPACVTYMCPFFNWEKSLLVYIAFI